MEAVTPYKKPAGELVHDSNEAGEIRFFSPGCRIGRLRYCAHYTLFTLAAYLVMAIVGAMAAAMGGDTGSVLVATFAVIVGIASLIVGFIFMVQRLHDLNKSGWLSLLLLIPLVNLFFLIYFLSWPGSPGRNNYGPPPPPNRWWHWVCGVLLPIVLIAIVTAIVLPNYEDYIKRVQEAPLQQ